MLKKDLRTVWVPAGNSWLWSKIEDVVNTKGPGRSVGHHGIVVLKIGVMLARETGV